MIAETHSLRVSAPPRELLASFTRRCGDAEEDLRPLRGRLR
jgi:hypothetical protein